MDHGRRDLYSLDDQHYFVDRRHRLILEAEEVTQ
nr:MAG TPA: hypothetical protein [Caudoviricetes sp.]